ncbi:MAG: PorT family protein [Bacteroidales bacterium]|nr:PorT family protein [Bacteroidales bacterium]
MKKVKGLLRWALLAVMLVGMALPGAAQRYYEPHFWVGGHAGVTLSNVQFSPSVEQQMLQGMTMGLSIRYSEEKIFGLIAEINLSQRGWKEKFDEGDWEYQRTLTYIQVPFLTHIFFGSKRFHGFVNLGPAASYMISSSISSNFDYMNPGSIADFPVENRSNEQMAMEVKNKFDYGIIGGAGIELFFGHHSIQLEGRYYFGLGNVYSARKRDVFSASRPTSIEITLGYNFAIK